MLLDSFESVFADVYTRIDAIVANEPTTDSVKYLLGRVPNNPQVWARWSRPVVALLSLSASAVMRLLPIRESAEPGVTDEELTALVAVGAKAGSFHPAEEEMVRGVLTLGDRRARMVMTHRQDVVWLDVRSTSEELQRKISESSYSRFPVGDGSLDQLLGIVDLRDIVRACFARSPLDLARSPARHSCSLRTPRPLPSSRSSKGPAPNLGW